MSVEKINVWEQKKMVFAGIICWFIVAFNLYQVLHPYFLPPTINLSIGSNTNTNTNTKPIVFNYSNSRTDAYEINGDVRFHVNSSTIFIASSSEDDLRWFNSRIIKPYPRKLDETAMRATSTFTIHTAPPHALPRCTQHFTSPAILFSVGGFSGNFFHDFADVLLPLFQTSFHFNTDVHFLAADNRPWWLSRFDPIFRQLTRHRIHTLDTDHGVLCFSKLTVGLKFDEDLRLSPTSDVSMSQFRRLIRRAYSLDRESTTGGGGGAPPRLILVSRKQTRVLTNEEQVCAAARKLGYEVVLAEGDARKSLRSFAQLVNSCDVMVGVHGAGVTNMVFLPEKAVLLVILPLGTEVIAHHDYGDPSKEMMLKYFDYKIEVKESSLVHEYGVDDPVVKNAVFSRKPGWGKLRDIYLHHQNVTVDIPKFTPSLVKALHLLRT